MSTHYYVLSLGKMKSELFEAFRDTLIDVENRGFPVTLPTGDTNSTEHEQRYELARTVDETFGYYYTREPLSLVVVGTPEMQSSFDSVTVHGSAILGRIEGDHTATSTRDLGQIVWPVVKEAMAGVLNRALHDLEDRELKGLLVTGLEAVVRATGKADRATLLVEDNYHQRGSIRRTSGSAMLTPDVDVREVVDDVVDALINKVLQFDGHVVFTPPGILRHRKQIVLLLPGSGNA